MSPVSGFLKAVPATKTERKTIGIPLYSNFNSLDVLGPFQTFTMAAGQLEPKLLAASKAPVKSFEGVEITPHATFDETKSLDVLFVPGGIKLEDILKAGGPDDTLRQFGCALEEQLPSRRYGWPTIRMQWSVRRHGANDNVPSLKAVSPDHAWIVSDLHLSVGGAVKRGPGARANR